MNTLERSTDDQCVVGQRFQEYGFLRDNIIAFPDHVTGRGRQCRQPRGTEAVRHVHAVRIGQHDVTIQIRELVAGPDTIVHPFGGCSWHRGSFWHDYPGPIGFMGRTRDSSAGLGTGVGVDVEVQRRTCVDRRRPAVQHHTAVARANRRCLTANDLR